MAQSSFYLTIGISLLAAASALADGPTAEQSEFFEKKVRPLLVEHCYSCHSATAAKLKGGLRVDGRALLIKGGDNGPAIVSGQPEKSRLIEAIHYKNVDMQMPPAGKLRDAAIADLTAWVKMGAPWPGDQGAEVVKEEFDLQKRKAAHWSWQPIKDVYPPAVKDEAWSRANFDRFILAKLEDKGLTPAKQAEPLVLLRRIYFDLVGLPPTVEQIAEFEREWNATPQAAIEKVVDKLLSSPQYGERWARHWLDLVRYAESRGHEFDPNIPNAWNYRDYVIRAFNADVPYNQLVLEHIAGDLLKEPRLNREEKFNESILGTGFWHLGEEVHSPVDIRADEADRFDNRIDVFSKTFLALTVSCARCHDHKFDAISTKDYYALYGFLRSSHYRQVRFDTIEHNKQVMKELTELREKHRPQILKALAETFKPGVEQLPKILEQARESMKTGKKSDNELVQFWVAYLEKAKKNPEDPFHEWADTSEKGLRGRPRVGFLSHDDESIVDYSRLKPSDWLVDDVSFGFRSVRDGEPRYSTNRLRPITEFNEIGAAVLDPTAANWVAAAKSQNEPGALAVPVRAGRTLHTPGFTIGTGRINFLVKGNGRSYAGIDAHTVVSGPLHGALVKDFNTNGKWQWITHDLASYAGHVAHLELSPNDDGEFCVAIVTQGKPWQPGLVGHDAWWNLPLSRQCGQVISGLEAGDLSKHARGYLANWMLDNPALLGVKDFDKIAEVSGPFIEEQAKIIAKFRKESRLAPAMIDGTGYNEHVFIRGSHKALGEVVPRRFLEALAGNKGIDASGSGRLELATQMLDPKTNPYISRVIVNRIWHHLLGRGIVASTDNFGVLGERPTHPELLDHLATQFVREGWSMKKLIRQIVLSRTYQMSSGPDPKADAVDPENLLLHRARLRRLEGEAIRDSLLVVADRLNAKMYGPPVPVHLTPFLDGRGKPASGPIDSEGRRSLYIGVRRNFLSPMMLAFDTPSPFSTVGRRTVSNVPAQALILMNDPFVHQMAESWGKNVATTKKDDPSRIKEMYLRAFTRPPTDVEVENCRAYLQSRKSKGDEKAWAELAHVLINVKEFIFVK